MQIEPGSQIVMDRGLMSLMMLAWLGGRVPALAARHSNPRGCSPVLQVELAHPRSLKGESTESLEYKPQRA